MHATPPNITKGWCFFSDLFISEISDSLIASLTWKPIHKNGYKGSSLGCFISNFSVFLYQGVMLSFREETVRLCTCICLHVKIILAPYRWGTLAGISIMLPISARGGRQEGHNKCRAPTLRRRNQLVALFKNRIWQAND